MKRVLRSLVPAWLVAARRARYHARKAAPDGRLLQALCPVGCTAVDVGGNLGGYTWYLRSIAARVHVFEPDPSLAAHLRWAFLFDRVHVHRCALSDQRGNAVLRTPIREGHRLHGLATVEPTNMRSGMRAETAKVRLARLDDFRLGNVGFIKIDVEGHELAVVRGAAETLRRCRPTLLIEAIERYHPQTVASLRAELEPLGYCGWFEWGGEWTRIERFNAEIHQKPGAIDEVGTPIGEYVLDFVFAYGKIAPFPAATMRASIV